MGSEWTVTRAEAGLRLDKFLAGRSRLGSRGRAVSALERGKVFLNGGEAPFAARATRLAAGDVVRVWMDRPGSAKAPLRPGQYGALRVVYEDDVLIVADKPAGLLAVPLAEQADAPSIYDHVQQHFRSRGKRRPLVVHRIDRDTSGLVVFAKNARAQAVLKEQFKKREPERVYWAVVYGHPDPPEGTWCDRLAWDRHALIQRATHARDPRGRDAISEYRVLERFRGASLIEVRLRTGRRNQIRLQTRLRGHTLVGEKRYASPSDTPRPIPFGRQALHARRLSFRHPVDGRTLTFESRPPEDFEALLARLRRG